MARKYEGSAADEAEDARGAKAMGLSKKAYEKTSRDKREDRAGQNRISVGAHTRSRPKRPSPAPTGGPSPSSFAIAQPPGGGNDNFPDVAGPPTPPSPDQDVDTEGM